MRRIGDGNWTHDLAARLIVVDEGVAIRNLLQPLGGALADGGVEHGEEPAVARRPVLVRAKKQNRLDVSRRVGNPGVERLPRLQIARPLVGDFVREGQHAATSQFQDARRWRLGRYRYVFGTSARRELGYVRAQLQPLEKVDPAAIARRPAPRIRDARHRLERARQDVGQHVHVIGGVTALGQPGRTQAHPGRRRESHVPGQRVSIGHDADAVEHSNRRLAAQVAGGAGALQVNRQEVGVGAAVGKTHAALRQCLGQGCGRSLGSAAAWLGTPESPRP